VIPGLQGKKGDTGAPGGGGGSATTVEVNTGSAAIWQGKFTITDGTITSSSKVLCWQAPGPYTGKGTMADEAEMAPVEVLAVEPATGTAVVKWRSVQGFHPRIELSRPLNRTPASAVAFDIVGEREIQGMKVLGKVRGNIKFSYLVFS
jgi:hypothetical protein